MEHWSYRLRSRNKVAERGNAISSCATDGGRTLTQTNKGKGVKTPISGRKWVLNDKKSRKAKQLSPHPPGLHQTTLKYKNYNPLKTLVPIIIACLLALPVNGATTKEGWFFALTQEDAHRAAVVFGEPDAKVVLDKMVAAQSIWHLKGGLDIAVLERSGGLVKFRLRNSPVELWTCSEAIAD
jgi:hypothetical protein